MVQSAPAGVCRGYLGTAAAVPKEMFYASQDATELMPHKDSWRLIRLQPGSSAEIKPQHPPLLALSKHPDPLRKRPPHCSDPSLPLLRKKRERGEVVFPVDAESLARKTTGIFCVERPTGKVHLPAALPGQQNR